MIIYRITNKLNGKDYIGQTVAELSKRMAEHFKYNKDTLPLHNAIRKYGANGFTISELGTYNTLQELNDAEEYFIEYYNCRVPYGYNLRAGGGNHGALHESTKQKLREMNTGIKHPQFGTKHSNETKQKISAGNKGKQRTPEMNLEQSKRNTGKPMREETKQKISLATKGKKKSLEMRQKLSASKMGAKHPMFQKPAKNRTAIQCIETGIIYSSQREAASALKCSISGINQAVTKIKPTILGFTFKYV